MDDPCSSERGIIYWSFFDWDCSILSFAFYCFFPSFEYDFEIFVVLWLARIGVVSSEGNLDDWIRMLVYCSLNKKLSDIKGCLKLVFFRCSCSRESSEMVERGVAIYVEISLGKQANAEKHWTVTAFYTSSSFISVSKLLLLLLLEILLLLSYWLLGLDWVICKGASMQEEAGSDVDDIFVDYSWNDVVALLGRFGGKCK